MNGDLCSLRFGVLGFSWGYCCGICLDSGRDNSKLKWLWIIVLSTFVMLDTKSCLQFWLLD